MIPSHYYVRWIVHPIHGIMTTIFKPWILRWGSSHRRTAKGLMPNFVSGKVLFLFYTFSSTRFCFIIRTISPSPQSFSLALRMVETKTLPAPYSFIQGGPDLHCLVALDTSEANWVEDGAWGTSFWKFSLIILFEFQFALFPDPFH